MTTFSFLVVVGLSGLSRRINKPARDTPNTNFTAASSNGDYVELCKLPAISSFAQDTAKITACENDTRYFQFPGAFLAARTHNGIDEPAGTLTRRGKEFPI
ncbi:MAG: hypothetical protein AB7F22_09850 [Reyranella sp.]|uniref:hypothetical protein n=1 Tax=Reyranella sp. TaxID=1929291 RepID=UPI003D0C7A94